MGYLESSVLLYKFQNCFTISLNIIGTMVEIAGNLWIIFGNMVIFTILIFLTYEHRCF